MSLRLKLAAAVAAALLVLLVGGASYYAARESKDAGLAVDHTEQVRTQVERTLRTLLDAEAGQRGYILTGDSTYLRPYATARTDVDHEMASLRELTGDDSIQRSRVDSLALAIDAKLVELNASITLLQVGQRDSALKVFVQGSGIGLTERVRSLTSAMEATETHLLAQRTTVYNNRKLAVTLITTIGSLIAALLSILTVASIRSSIVQLERAKDTIEEQSSKLAEELDESQALTQQIAATNDRLLQANRAVESARAGFEQLLESTDQGLFGMDNDGICTFVNSAGARMLDYARDDLVGQNIHDKIHGRRPDGSPYPVAECPIHLAFRTGAAVRISDEVFWRKDGTPQPIEYASSPIMADGVCVGAVVAYSDISARKVAERDRERLITALARSNQELDQFAYVASHDLKAPLRGIANLSQWIEEDLGASVPPEVVEKMNLMRGRVHRLEALIDGVLQYSRAGRARAQIELVEVGPLVHEAIELLAPPADISITVDDNMPTVMSERTPLQQVFMNLIGNAIKYNRRPGATIHVSVRDAGRFYAFSVADNGPGIEKEYHQRVFGIFQTLESRDKVEGTGIGLSVVKKTVELRGGTVTIDSALGEGATFTFEWPKLASEDAA